MPVLLIYEGVIPKTPEGDYPTPLASKTITSLPTVSIGRHELNDVCIKDSSVSRFHAALFLNTTHDFFVQDLGSRNGTYINGKRSNYGPIREGDVIGIGNYTLLFQRQSGKRASTAKQIKIIGEETGESEETIRHPLLDRGKQIDVLKGDAEGLALLYRISRIAGMELETESSLQFILEELQTAFQPERLFIGLFGENGVGLRCLVCLPDQESIDISHTLLHSVREGKEIVMTPDALVDYERSHRVTSQHIRAAVAVPLLWRGECRGLLYMDSLSETGLFTDKELRLLSVIGDDISAFVERSMMYESIVSVKARLQRDDELKNTIIGISPKNKELLRLIDRFADTDATVLITGETGTGKGLVARQLHKKSERRNGPFIHLICNEIPEPLIESELFGIGSRVATDVKARPGLFKLADGGTLFLDEIGELPTHIQVKLLRAIEEKEIRPIGEERSAHVDVRVVAATNRDLEEDIKKGRFREDFYARLNVLQLHVPPLREREEDIPLLAGYFLYTLRKGDKVSHLSSTCIEMLRSYAWPRNVRELRNAVERAILLANPQNRPVALSHKLFDEIKRRSKRKAVELPSLADVEREHIELVLNNVQRNMTEAAKVLGISRQSLYNKCDDYRIDRQKS